MFSRLTSVNELFTRKLHDLLKARQRRAIETTEPYTVGSSIGSVRSKNEDTGLICRVRHTERQRDFDLALVCDGMGGMTGGQAAALIAASVFTSAYIAHDVRRTEDRLRVGVMAAQRRVFEVLRGEGGTTLSAVAVPRHGEPWSVHVGDSRIYELLEDDLVQLTTDQTIGSLLKGGEGRPDAHRLLQFVGMDEELEPQLSLLRPLPGSGYLLTSDGAHGAPHDMLRRVARHARSGSDAVRRLLSLADLLGGVDNATGVFLPSALDEASVPDPLGLTVTVLTPSGEHDTWLPGNWPGRFDQRQPGGPSSVAEAGVTAHPQQRTPNAKTSPKQPPPTRKKRKSVKPKTAEAPPFLSENEQPPRQVSLKFEDGQE